MELQAKLLAIQCELVSPKNQYNEFGKYHYRSCEDILEAVKPLCKKHGAVLTVTDTVECCGDRVYIVATATLADTKTVSVDGEEVAFTKTEFELLRLLLEHKGRVFSRQELIDHVWPSDVMVLDRTVDVNITRMRKKIGRYAPCISTRLGYGYYFNP